MQDENVIKYLFLQLVKLLAGRVHRLVELHNLQLVFCQFFCFHLFLKVLILATLILAKLVKLHNTQLAQERTIKVFLKTKLIDKLDTWDCEAG